MLFRRSFWTPRRSAVLRSREIVVNMAVAAASFRRVVRAAGRVGSSKRCGCRGLPSFASSCYMRADIVSGKNCSASNTDHYRPGSGYYSVHYSARRFGPESGRATPTPPLLRSIPRQADANCANSCKLPGSPIPPHRPTCGFK